MIHEEFFNAFSCVINNKTHPRQGATAAKRRQRPCLWNLTCANGVSQRGVVLGSQQRLVITRVALQLLLSTTGCHPDPGSVLVGHAFAHVPFHFGKDRLVYMNTQMVPRAQTCCLGDPSPVRFFSTCGLSCRSLDHRRDLLLSTATYSFIISL